MSSLEKRIVMESVSTLFPLYHNFGLSTQGMVNYGSSYCLICGSYNTVML